VLAALGTVAACRESGGPPSPVGPPSSVAAVVASLDSVTIVPGGQIQLRAVTLDSIGNQLHGYQVQWRSTDDTKAVVDSAGLVTGRVVGSVDILATRDARSDTTHIGVVTVIFRQISAGAYHACGVTPLGRAFCWGNGALGMLGFGDTVSTPAPVAVAGHLTFSEVSAGTEHTCGVATDGTLYCWGGNRIGQLGIGTRDTLWHQVPTAITDALTFMSLDAGEFHTCALTNGGHAYCWGYNGYGENGDGSLGNVEASPVPVSGGLSFLAARAGTTHSCAIAANNAGYCWGNSIGLGADSFPSPCVLTGLGYLCPSPTPVGGAREYQSIDAAWGHSCGVTTSGSAYCWGGNGSGQLGAATSADFHGAPLAVNGGLVFALVTTGYAHTCALTPTGQGYCWGANGAGQLGDGTGVGGSSMSSAPVAVAGGLVFASLSAGFAFTCGVTRSQVGYCWGKNDFGQLGTGPSTWDAVSLAPVRVSGQP
jgi:alpha-tubulin suppressor-like RCC1 family protein